MLELIAACLSAIGNLSLSVLVLSKNPRGRLNRDFARFGGTLALWALLNYVSLHPFLFDQLTWIRIVMAVVSFMMLFILLLANTFPTGERYIKKIELWSIPGAFVVSVVAISPWLFTSLTYSAGGQPQPIAGPGMSLFVIYVLATLGTSIVILLRKFLRLKGVAKEYIRYGLIGIIVTFALLLLTNFVVVLAFKNSSLVAFSPLTALIFTASFAYGIVRRKLFDVRLIAARFVAYLMMLLFASVLYGFSTAGLSFLIADVYPGWTQITVSTMIVAVLILFVEPLRKFFNHVTRAIFYQDDYDTKNVLDDIATILVHSTETKPLVEGSLTVLRKALKPEFITLMIVDHSQDNSKRLSVGVHPPELPDLTPEQLLHYVADVVSVDSVESHPNHFHREMQKAGVSVVVRLQTRSEIVGYCFFGYKTTGSAYSKRDVDLIRIASDELAVAIQNTLRFEQIQDFNDTLRQRIGEATKELRASNEQLQRLDEAKDEFVSMASHQLRTPLTSVKGYISMVLEGDVGKITKMQRQLLDEAFTSSERMVHLINDFLNVSRLQTGKFIIEARPTDLAKIISQEVESLQTTAGAHDLKLRYEGPVSSPILYIDESKIRQVIMNFIDNAIYYSHEHTTIMIKLALENGEAVLTVVDSGIGVPKAEQSHLFTKFFRATNARRQRPDGTGVGLFLAKKVVDAHGGRIIFESIEGEGSTFGFRLPIKKLSTARDADKLEN